MRDTASSDIPLLAGTLQRPAFKAEFILRLLLIVAKDSWRSENVSCNIEMWI